MVKKKIGLVLSGGGVKSIFSQPYIIEWLEKKHNIKKDDFIISATSGGSIVAGFYKTLGLKKSIELLNKLSPKDFIKPDYKEIFLGLVLPNRGVKGLLSSKKLKKAFEKLIGKDTKIPKNLYIVGTDLVTGKEIIFNNKSNVTLAEAMAISSSIPVVFSPLKVNNTIYGADGGINNNVPVDILIDKNIKTIYVVTFGRSSDIKPNKVEKMGLLGIGDHVIDLFVENSWKMRKKKEEIENKLKTYSNLLNIFIDFDNIYNEYKIITGKSRVIEITIPIGGVGTLDFDKKDLIIRKTKEVLEKIS